jgi:hypothetical protein
LSISASHDDLIDALAYMIQMDTYHSDDSNHTPTREEYLEDLGAYDGDDDDDDFLYGGNAF